MHQLLLLSGTVAAQSVASTARQADRIASLFAAGLHCNIKPMQAHSSNYCCSIHGAIANETSWQDLPRRPWSPWEALLWQHAIMCNTQPD